MTKQFEKVNCTYGAPMGRTCYGERMIWKKAESYLKLSLSMTVMMMAGLIRDCLQICIALEAKIKTAISSL